MAHFEQMTPTVVKGRPSVDNFVEPAAIQPIRPYRVEVLPPAAPMTPTVPTTSRTDVMLKTTYVDRARGFNTVAVPLSAAVGVGSLIIGVAGFAVPVFSVGALATLWLGFLATWLVAWAIHTVISPEGNALVTTFFAWGWLAREQRHRHDLERWQSGYYEE